MAGENADFYRESSPLSGKLTKFKRKLRTSSSVLMSLLNNDYSGRKLPYSWESLPTRFDLINRLIADRGYADYLEVGCSTDACFQNIAAPHKLGVDPFSGGTHRMTSDEFFAANQETFDIIFVDGLHQYAQVKTDLRNSIEVLNEGGVILVHDCLPLTYRAQLPFPAGGAWNGDVWKALVEIRTQPDVDAAVCLIDHGVGIITRRANRRVLDLGTDRFIDLRFKEFVEKYAEWLNIIGFEEALRFPGAH
jgi:hypothetical protein